MKRPLSIVEVGRRGGNTHKKKGREYFVELGKKSGQKKLELYGPEYFSRISKIGRDKRRAEKLEHDKNTLLTSE